MRDRHVLPCIDAGLAAAATGDRVGVVQVLDSPNGSSAPEVAGHLRTDAPGTHIAAAAALNTFDIAVVQHEYGIYGGQDGDQLLAVLDRVRVPVILVAHTVLAQPTPRQALILQRVIAASDAVVVMTDAANERLVRLYGVDPAKVSVIRHGAGPRRHRPRPGPAPPADPDLGAAGTGKGIEWGIDGLQPSFGGCGHCPPTSSPARPTRGSRTAGRELPAATAATRAARGRRGHAPVRRILSGRRRAHPPDPAGRRRRCCPTTLGNRSRRGCWSRRSRPASRWLPPPFPTRSNCWAAAPVWSCRTRRPRGRAGAVPDPHRTGPGTKDAGRGHPDRALAAMAGRCRPVPRHRDRIAGRAHPGAG